MKKSLQCILFSFFIMLTLVFSNSYAQLNWSVGANVGYGAMDMSDVNDMINDAYDKVVNESQNYSVEKQEVSAGLYFDGGVYLEISKLMTGVSVSYISSDAYIKGEVDGNDGEIKFDFNTIEVMGLVGTNLPLGPRLDVILRAYIGLGIPQVDMKDRDGNKWEGSGNYFSAKGQAGVELDLSAVLLNASIAYRYADAGELKGDATSSEGEKITDQNPQYNDKNLNFDFSGVLISAGIRIPF